MPHRFLILILILLPGTFHSLWGQGTAGFAWGTDSFFQDAHAISGQKAESFFFRFNNANFFKNNEYRNAFSKGQSLFGSFAEPQLEYYATERTRLSAGVHLLKYYGRDSLSRVLPFISVRHRFNKHLDLIFGSLEGTSNHGILEPMMGFETYLINHPENGLQLLWNDVRLQGDFWLNWEQFILPNDPFQEHFTAGGHLRAALIQNDTWNLRMDLQMIFRHQGGEIDLSDLPALTYGNLSQGIQISRKLNSSIFKEIGFHYYLLEAFKINPPPSDLPNKGWGHYPWIECHTRLGSFRSGYWWGESFSSPLGEALFLTESQYQNYSMPNRQLITLNYEKSRQLTPSLKLGLRLNAYYQMDTQRIDHAWGLYLLFDQDFFLGRIKQAQ